MTPVAIAIDGPAASGKSTTARGVAERLGYRHVNSGRLYRAVTWAAVEGGWADAGREEFRRKLDRLELELVPAGDGYRVRVDGGEPGDALTSPRVTSRVSEVSARPEVRERVNRILRDEADRRDVVCDGRDVGTAVFPDADLKVYVVASPEERARRRLLQLGEEPTLERVRSETERIRARDEADSTRALDPLRRAEDAVQIDTTDLTPAEVVEAVVREARRRDLSG